MDKFKGLAKGGWHPTGDPKISRDSWKSDIKGMTVNRNKDPYEAQRSHQSAPLTSLKDPDSFGAPPKHSGWYSGSGTPTSPSGSSASGGGLGSAIRTPVRRQTQEQQLVEEQIPKPPSGPYRADTTGINTSGLPKPPVRRADGAGVGPVPPCRSAVSPPVPARQAQRQAAQRAPPPSLPPRMNENPDEYTPPPPPTYQQATAQPAAQTEPAAQNPATINGVAVGRLAQAGVNVPGFGIGGDSGGNTSQTPPRQVPAVQGHSSQLSELQQRFSRMGTAGSDQASPAPRTAAISSNAVASAAAQKKAPPPPPPVKKAALGGRQPGIAEGGDAAAPPPLPLSSKPRPS